MKALEISNLGKAYRSYISEWSRVFSWFGLGGTSVEEVWVLRKINFIISPGEAIGVIGQNGAGKSTLLKLITGTLRPTEGSIITKGRIAAILELGMGFNPELTGRQNVFHAAGLMGFSANEIQKAMTEIETFAEVGEYFDEPMRTYSSGMQMRVAFSIATSFRPDTLIVDEALSVGDAAFQRKCFRRIENYISQGTSLLLVSHDMETIKKMCSKAIYLENGMMRGFGDAKSVCENYEKSMLGYEAQEVDNAAIENLSRKSRLSRYDENLVILDSDDYGDGRVEIEKVWLEDDSGNKVNVISAGDIFYLKYIVRVLSPVENPVFAFLIKSLEGVELYGSDTKSLNISTRSYMSEDRALISIKLRNCLAAGVYFVNCGVRDDSESNSVFMRRRVDATMFKVIQSVDLYQAGIVNMNASFSLDSISNG